jgi:hypothetical protein
VVFKGVAPAGSQVALFSAPNCSGPSLVSGTAAAFKSPGFAIHVASNATTTLHAVVYAAGGQLSSCSASTIRYVEDQLAPRGRITKHPKGTVRTRNRKASVKFSFSSNERGSTFKCKLDRGPYRACRSSKTYRLTPGSHTFRVRVTDAAGNVGNTARFSFKVVRIRKHHR